MKPKRQLKQDAFENIGEALWVKYGIHHDTILRPSLQFRLVRPLMARLKKPLKDFILVVGLKHNET